MKKRNTVNREISWLSFNERVLQEAADKSVPILERLRFLGIFSSNLDEFYRVRVATLKRIANLEERSVVNEEEEDSEQPKMVLKSIQAKVIKQRKWFDELYDQIKNELSANGVFIVNEKQVNQSQQAIIKSFFRTQVLRKLDPIMITEEDEDFPVLKDKSIYLFIRLVHSKGKLKTRYALLEIPTSVPRFLTISKSNESTSIIFLDDVIRLNFKELFSIFEFDTFDSYTLKVTRDAELDLDDDISKSYLQKISKSVQERKLGRAVRLTYDKELPLSLLSMIRKKLELNEGDDLIAGARYHNFKDFINFPVTGKKAFAYPPFKPLIHYAAPKIERLFEVLKKRDLLLHYPYHSFDYNIDLLREAAIDPYVTDIRMSIYRVSNPSSIVNSLINAIRNGKRVTVIVELQARFDEEANIRWANKLSEEGARVIEGVHGLKVHSKIMLIKRKIRGKTERYGVIGTGNFHERTATQYGDISLYTSQNAILLEVEKVFDFFDTNYKTGTYEHLLVAPFQMRDQIYKMIDREIELAKANRKAYMMIKLNSLVDEGIILKLYEASQAGVQIKMIIRGICSLKPGVPGLSDNIQVISIVDRFLEHARVLIFGNDGQEKYYISSADWMRRNLSLRTEVAVPIYDPLLQQELKDVFMLQWRDNCKARVIDLAQTNRYNRKGKIALRSQERIYNYFKRKLDD